MTIARSFESNNGEGEITLAVNYRYTRARRAVRKRARKQESPPPRTRADVRVKTREEVGKPSRLPATNKSFLFHNSRIL